MQTAIALPIDQIKNFCQHWQIVELSLFGSVLRDDFHADSDIDFLVAFAPTANWGLLDHAQMQQELEILLSRPVDLISKRAIERSSNWIRRQAILSTAQPIYIQGLTDRPSQTVVT
jgi:predicted nucleotidyltransferase